MPPRLRIPRLKEKSMIATALEGRTDLKNEIGLARKIGSGQIVDVSIPNRREPTIVTFDGRKLRPLGKNKVLIHTHPLGGDKITLGILGSDLSHTLLRFLQNCFDDPKGTRAEAISYLQKVRGGHETAGIITLTPKKSFFKKVKRMKSRGMQFKEAFSKVFEQYSQYPGWMELHKKGLTFQKMLDVHRGALQSLATSMILKKTLL